MNKITRLAVMIVAAWALSGISMPSICQAAPNDKLTAIPEDKMPSVAGAWFVGVLLSVGGIVVGIKNSRRTHLD